VPDWLKPQLLLIAVIGVLAAGSYFAVRWYTSDPLQDVEVQSLEAAWADAIANMWAVFPPKKTLLQHLLGRLWLRMMTQADLKTRRWIGGPRCSNVQKLANIVSGHGWCSLRDDSGFPVVRKPPGCQARCNPGRGATGKVLQRHGCSTPGKVTPRAAFSSLKIRASIAQRQASPHEEGGSTNFAASKEALEELRLAEVSTYGLPSVRALEILTAYCTDEKTKNHCLESTARKHLQPIVGDRVNLEYVDDKGNNRHAITVEIVIVSRVYLTRSITHLRRANSAQSGGARIAGPITQDDGAKVANDPPAPSPPGGEVANATAVKTSTNSKQLSQMRLGARSPRGVISIEIPLKELVGRSHSHIAAYDTRR
jgi:hypothetical protein